MNLNRYEQIDGREALRRLVDGERVFSKAGVEYKLNQYGFLYYLDDDMKDWKTSPIAFNQMIVHGFYIPKPFDVRQAMRERPNEWVGAFKDGVGGWHKLGFNNKRFSVEVRDLVEHGNYLPEHGSNGGWGVTEYNLDHCIPIEDVPEEVTR